MTGKHWGIAGGVATVILAVVALVAYLRPRGPQAPDFQVLTDPKNGAVQAGGTMAMQVTVDGRHGYQRPVRLSASGQPAGILVGLNPDKGVTNPSCVSTATITVDRDVPAGAYEIRITATADNDDKRYADFGLVVRAPTPADQGMPPRPEVKILVPADGATVTADLAVEGVITGQIPSGWYMWVLLNPHPSPGQFWPQGAEILLFGGKWRTQVHVGRPEDKGKRFDLWVYLVDSSLHERYTQWVAQGDRSGAFPPLPTPARDKAHALAKATVTLGE